MSSYEELFKKLKLSVTHNVKAKELIPKMCDALREADPTLSNEDIKRRVKDDCDGIGLDPEYVISCIPDEFKDKIKQNAGKQKNKAIEITNNGQIAQTTTDTAALNLKQNFVDKTTNLETQTYKNPTYKQDRETINYYDEMDIVLSMDDCREIKSNTILNGRKFRYSFKKMKVVKWY